MEDSRRFSRRTVDVAQKIWAQSFFLKRGGGKITQINTGFVVVDRGDENGRPHF